MSKKFINDYFQYLHTTIDKIENVHDELFNVSKLIAEKINTAGKVIFISAGPIAELFDNMIKSLRYLFKFDENKFRVIKGAKYYSEFKQIEKWKEFENSKSIGALAALESNLDENDLIIAMSVTGKTEYIHSYLEYGESIGANAFLITTSSQSNCSLNIKTINVLENNEMINSLFVSNHTTILKMIFESIIFSAFEDNGQIIDGYIHTTKIWTKKLLYTHFEVFKKYKNDITIEEIKELLEKTDNELSVALVMLKLKVSVSEAWQIVELNNFNFKNIF